MANTELIEFLPDTCSPQPVPHTYGCIGTRDTAIVQNSFGFDLPTDFGTTNAADTYFHAIDDTVNGITYHYPPATSNPTTPIVCTDVASIQAFLDSINSGITYNVNAFSEIVLTFANVGDESNWTFWLGNSDPDGYTNKTTPTLHDLQVDTQTYQQVQVVKSQQIDGTFTDRFFVPSGGVLVEVALNPENTFKFGNCTECKKEIFATHDRYITVPILLGGEAKCVGIQEIKEKDTCTGEETYRYVVENGSGKLVSASTVIANFDESKVLLSCPLAEEFDIKEREVCVTIDGSAQTYEAIKVYKRSRTSGLATLIHYETKAGDVINGTIVEVCCTCDTLCDVPTANPNKVAFGYATLFNGRLVAGDRITAGEELYVDYLEVDGNVLINSPLVVGTTTGGFTATDMGYGIGYNKVVDLLNTVPEFAANGVRFVTAAAPMAPNGAAYDPMMWGVEYDDTKDVRIVIRDIISTSSFTHSYSIRLTTDPSQTYDALINVVTDAANNWDYNNVVNYNQIYPLQNITSI